MPVVERRSQEEALLSIELPSTSLLEASALCSLSIFAE